MIGLLTAIFTALGGILTLLVWLTKRKRSPTKEERLDDVAQDYATNIETVHKLRAAGKHVEADELLRRLVDGKILSASHSPSIDRVRSHIYSSAIGQSPSPWERLVDGSTSGNGGDNTGGPGEKPVTGNSNQ